MTASEGVASIQSRILEIQRLVNATPPKVADSGSSAPASSDFAGVLSQATATLESADLSAYPNGKIPEHLLVPIGGNEKLAAPAAKAFLEMKSAAAQAGVSLPVNDSYRSFDEQVAMAEKKGIYGQGGLAAVPGRSDHGKGISVDIEIGSNNQQWMRDNAKRFGFVNDVAGEPWHWTYKP